MKNNKSHKSHLAQYYLRKAAAKGKKLLVVQVWNHVLSNWLSLIQYRSKVSYHLSSRFSPDGSRFSRDVSRFSWESLKHLVWHMLRVRNRLCVTIVALQFFAKSMGPSNRRYMYALMHWSFARFISNKHWTYEVIIIRHWISSSEKTVVFNNLRRKGNSS